MTTTAAPPVLEKPTPPWLFLFLELPFGAATGLAQVAVPFWLAAKGVPLLQIGEVSATVSQPHAWKLLWVPLLDIGTYRKRWYLASVLLTALSLGGALGVPDPVQQLGLYTLLLTLAQVGAATSSAALEALMATTTRLEDKGRVGGFKMAGNLGGSGLLAAGTMELVSHGFGQATGAIVGGVVLACGLGVLLVLEPQGAPLVGAFVDMVKRRLSEILRDLWHTAITRDGWTGLLVCLSPVGAAALTNLFSAMAGPFGAPDSQVEWINGVAGGVVSAVGCVAGGFLGDRINRRVAYGISGLLLAITAVAMAAGPRTPDAYGIGCSVYLFLTGIAYATFAGMVLELVGHGPAVTTKYTLFVDASNQAANYVTYLDGQASEKLASLGVSGVTGTLLCDGVLSFVGLGVLGALFVALARMPAKEPLPT
jgi:hypothetical protein